MKGSIDSIRLIEVNLNGKIVHSDHKLCMLAFSLNLKVTMLVLELTAKRLCSEGSGLQRR